MGKYDELRQKVTVLAATLASMKEGDATWEIAVDTAWGQIAIDWFERSATDPSTTQLQGEVIASGMMNTTKIISQIDYLAELFTRSDELNRQYVTFCRETGVPEDLMNISKETFAVYGIINSIVTSYFRAFVDLGKIKEEHFDKVAEVMTQSLVLKLKQGEIESRLVGEIIRKEGQTDGQPGSEGPT